VLEVGDNRVTQIKTDETDGYTAVQVTFGTRRASRVTKPSMSRGPGPLALM
jgi:large subunit ribosomal protein L3